MLIPSLVIFKEAFAIYKTNYKIFFKTIIWLMGVAVLLIVLNLIDRQTIFQYIGYTFPVYLIFTALSFVIGLWTQIVLIRLINAGLTHESIDQTNLKQNAWRDTVPFLWVSVLMGLIILGGVFLFIIPGLIFAIWYFFSIYVFTIDGIKGYAALQKSKSLIQGRFWAIVWRIIIANILYGLVLIILIGLPTLIIGALTQFSGFTPALSRGPWWIDALQSIITIATLPLNLALWVILYKNIKDNPINTSAPTSTI